MKYIKLFESWVSLQKTSGHSDHKMKDFIEGLQLHLEKNGWKVNIVNSLEENENLYFDEKTVNFAISDSMQMGEDTLKLYVMYREDMEPGSVMGEYHNEWDSKENKELVKPQMRNMSEIQSNSSFLFPETQVEFSKIPESLRGKKIYTNRYSVNSSRERINKEWLRSQS
jgi:hypothetical protein